MDLLRAVVIAGVMIASSVSAQPIEGILGNGPAADRTAIAGVLTSYLSVTDQKRQSAITEAFAPGATLMSVGRDGAIKAMSQGEWWERVSRIPAGAPARNSRIVMVDVAGVAAVARIDITNEQTGRVSTDYFNLMKTVSGWRIVNKTLSIAL
jgi:hypothetical protein